MPTAASAKDANNCGEHLQACCPPSSGKKPCSDPRSSCQNGQCLPCGIYSFPCCGLPDHPYDETSCSSDTTCELSSGICKDTKSVVCGDVGQQCCRDSKCHPDPKTGKEGFCNPLTKKCEPN